MEVLKLKFELNRFEGKNNFKTKLEEAGLEINNLFKKAESKWADAKVKYSNFSNEIEQSYEHLKKAIQTL